METSGGPTDSQNICRRWIGTFPRKVLDVTRKQVWSDILVQLPPSLPAADASPHFQRSSQSFSVIWSTEEQARDFSTWFGMNCVTWKDPRCGTVTQLRCRGDLPHEVRMRQRHLGQAWMPLMKLLRAHRDWTPRCKPGCSGFSNAITVTTDKDVWDLIRVDSDGHA
eukprot:6424814-Pyramimonas_sp.AAC.1